MLALLIIFIDYAAADIVFFRFSPFYLRHLRHAAAAFDIDTLLLFAIIDDAMLILFLLRFRCCFPRAFATPATPPHASPLRFY